MSNSSDGSDGTVLAGRYELGRTLGAGGMARVVEANDRVLHRRVAIKLAERDLAQTADPSLTARFVAEARTTATLTHRNLVDVYDAGDSDGYLYLVTELVDGTNLAERIASEGPLPIGEATRITGELLSALGAAHRAGIVHRDVKPSNVLLDRAGTVKLADFGIAKRLDDLEAALTRAGEIVGTPRYVSPEQAVGEPSTPATDLYATGVVLYEMLAGTPPFEGESPMATLLAHRDRPVPDVRLARPDVPPALAAVVSTAMAKRPDDRYPSAEAMRAAVLGDARGTALAGGAAAAAMAPTVAAGAAAPTPTAAYPPINPVGPAAASGGGDRGGSGASVWWWAAAAALLALGGGAIVMAASQDGDGDGNDPNLVASTTTTGRGGRNAGANTSRTEPTTLETAAPTTASPTTTTLPPTTTLPATTEPPETAPPTEPPVVAPELPNDLGELTAVLAGDPSLFGEHAEKLLDHLEEVLSEDDSERQFDAADKALRDLEKWERAGEMDTELAGQVAAALQPYLEVDEDPGPPEDPGNSDGRGNSGGDGDDEGDDD